MNLRGRLIGAVTALTLVTLGGAFTVVSAEVNAVQERRLDHELVSHACDEARDAAQRDAHEIRERPGPFANGVGPLPRHGVLYDRDGAALDATPNFERAVPAFARVRRPDGGCFDLWFAGTHLRAVVVPVPDGSGRRLLFALPRTDLDGDEAFLRHAMSLVFAVAVAWSVVVATWLVRRLTREHQAIAEVARRVAAGDLRARVHGVAADRDVAQLGHDIDDMIARLEALVTSQQRFVAHAAHELRLPLTTLLGELSLALRKPRDAGEYRAAIAEALGATRRLKQLADDLLALARVGSGGPAPTERVAAREVAEAAVAEVRAYADARGVTVSLAGGDDALRGRPADLRRLLRNLLENAVRHAPRGSDVTLTVSAGDPVLFRVRDRGGGVAEPDRARIFDAFYRAAGHRDDDDTGAGLGLALARKS
jgi:two-component system heavy metal sensor histidine kinase CusS